MRQHELLFRAPNRCPDLGWFEAGYPPDFAFQMLQINPCPHQLGELARVHHFGLRYHRRAALGFAQDFSQNHRL
jgi:hypothetical protein